MNAEQRYELLIEYAEGTLPAERRMEVEQMLQHSPEMQNDLETLNLAFDSLQVERQPDVPDQYFANFVGTLRRHIESGDRRMHWSVPQFILRLLQPAAALAVTAAVVLLFRAFDPATSDTTIYSLVKDVEQNEINTLIEESTTFSEGRRTIFLYQNYTANRSESIRPVTKARATCSHCWRMMKRN